MPRLYSIIIPIYNRPDELDELLDSLTKQTYKHFEILVVEDGSTVVCEHIVSKYSAALNISYYVKTNGGQGFARNYAFERAKGDYFVQFDSDAIIPENYFEIVENSLNSDYLDAYGGPDAAHKDFTDTQKAINYAMTSLLTTGGTRGKKKNLGGQFHPRSFNFGISKEVYQKVGGYVITRMAEDIEFSIRIIAAGFKVGLIEEAFIYHKRRATLAQFFTQLKFFGRGRINIWRFYKNELKLVHLLPVGFTLFTLSLPVLFFINTTLFTSAIFVFLLYFLIIFLHSLSTNSNFIVALLSIPAAFIQLFAYGLGFISELSKGLNRPNK